MARRFVLPLSLLLCLVAGHAFAQDGESANMADDAADSDSERGIFERESIYIIGGGAWGFQQFPDEYRRTDDGYGLNASVGGRMFEHFAAEAQFEWMHEFRLQPPGGVTRSADTYAMFANIKGYPLKGRIQPYALFGIGGVIANSPALRDGLGTTSSEIQSNFAFRAGAGVEAYVTDNWFVSAEGAYVYPTGLVGDFRYVSLKWGIGYRF